MYIYNPGSLKRLKKQFKISHDDYCIITGLAHKNSVTKRMKGLIPITAHEIALLCNYTKQLARNNPDLEPHIFTPSSFYDEV